MKKSTLIRMLGIGFILGNVGCDMACFQACNGLAGLGKLGKLPCKTDPKMKIAINATGIDKTDLDGAVDKISTELNKKDYAFQMTKEPGPEALVLNISKEMVYDPRDRDRDPVCKFTVRAEYKGQNQNIFYGGFRGNQCDSTQLTQMLLNEIKKNRFPTCEKARESLAALQRTMHPNLDNSKEQAISENTNPKNEQEVGIRGKNALGSAANTAM